MVATYIGVNLGCKHSMQEHLVTDILGNRYYFCNTCRVVLIHNVDGEIKVMSHARHHEIGSVIQNPFEVTHAGGKMVIKPEELQHSRLTRDVTKRSDNWIGDRYIGY